MSASKRTRITISSPMIAVLLAVLGIGGFYYWSTAPQRLFRQAENIHESEPLQAQHLLEEAIYLSEGDYPEAELLLCKILLLRGKPVESLGAWGLLEDSATLPAADLWELAELAMQTQFDPLSDRVLKVTTNIPEYRERALESLVQSHLRRQLWGSAERYSRELLDEGWESAVAWYVLGRNAYQRKQLLNSREAFRKCLALSDDTELSQRAHLSLIAVLYDEGLVDRMRAEIDRYRDRHGNTPQLAFYESRLLRLQGRISESLELLSSHDVTHPELVVPARQLRANLLLDLDRNVEAVSDLQFVVNKQPWNHEARYKLSLAYRRLGRMADSEAQLELSQEYAEDKLELLALESQLGEGEPSAEVRQRLVELYQRFGQNEKANRLKSP